MERKDMKIILTILIFLVLLIFIVVLGLKVKPKPFHPFPDQTKDLGTFPLPENLPAPVQRFYTTIYGEQIPLIESAVISGRAPMRVSGITLPARFRFTHITGQDYRHYIETTFFGLPVIKINESYLEGKSRMELPFGVIENEPKIDQAANLGLWAESIWFPSILISDPRIRWEPIDENSALLVVPFGEEEDTFVARFNPETGLLQYLEAMRYRDAGDEAKTLWINEVREWGEENGKRIPIVGAVTWFDQGTPWAVFTVEEVILNADMSEYILEKGP
jgi:hypothetical protein